MAKQAARKDDRVVGMDTHQLKVGQPPAQPGQVEFTGELSIDLSDNVFIGGRAAALKGSRANLTLHDPPVGSSFEVAPASPKAAVTSGSGTVFINGRSAARDLDRVTTDCSTVPGSHGRVSVNAPCEVYIGGD